MKTMKTLTLGATLLLLILSLPVIAQDSTQALSSHYDELANLPFPGAFPTKGPAGNYLSTPVADTKLLERLHVGEVVVVTYSEAVVLSLQKVEK